MWVRINKKWEGKCFTFNPPEEISHRGIKNINIISRFPFDLDISFHGKNQATDSELNGISFIAMYRQYYIVEISVEVILNRNTKRMPCIGSSGNIDEIRNRVAVDMMTKVLGCVVPYVDRTERRTPPICTNSTASDIAIQIYEGIGPYYDLYDWKNIPQPCKQNHVEPRKSFESPEWDNQTWINAQFMKMSKITEQQEAYPLESFYAEVGGFAGLLLGISVYQLCTISLSSFSANGLAKKTNKLCV